ncbi:hypothetical protein OESDEN_02510, partial [Oesophagostomum dentatum]
IWGALSVEEKHIMFCNPPLAMNGAALFINSRPPQSLCLIFFALLCYSQSYYILMWRSPEYAAAFKEQLRIMLRKFVDDSASKTGEFTLTDGYRQSANKASEAIPLLNKLVTLLSQSPKEIVEEEKRARSVVVSGLPEATHGTPAFERQLHTERLVQDVLNELQIECPSEIFRMGRPIEGVPRLVKIVFSSQRSYFDILKKARDLRHHDRFKHVFVKRSMTAAERSRYQELRAEATRRNQHEFSRVIRFAYIQNLHPFSTYSFMSSAAKERTVEAR